MGNPDPVVVIGGGLGGLAVALELRRRHYDVVVLERHAVIGGKASTRTWEGYRWDEGPSIVVMPWVYQELFQNAGLDPNAYLPLTRLSPAFKVVLSDGQALDVPADADGLRHSLAKIDAQDADRLPAFLEKADKFAKIIGHSYCDRMLETWPQVMLSPLMLSAMVLSPNKPYTEEINSYFQNPRVRELFYGFPTYSGFDPTTAPASLILVSWTMIREGVWYPQRGGIAGIPLAVGRACVDLGVEVRANTEVEAIARDAAGVIEGVQTSSGFIRTRIVISNSDYVHTYRMLRGGPGFSAPVQALRDGQARPSTSFFTLQLATDRAWPLLAHHLLVLTPGSEKIYEEIYLKNVYPSDPPLYVNTTSVTQSNDAPAGCANPFVVVNAPPLPPDLGRDVGFESRYADAIMSRLDKAGLSGIASACRHRTLTTPSDWQTKFHAFRGAIYGLGPEHNILGGGFRPVPYCRETPGLYFVGGAVQPGPGMPMVVQSGKIVAAQIARRSPRKPKVMMTK